MTKNEIIVFGTGGLFVFLAVWLEITALEKFYAGLSIFRHSALAFFCLGIATVIFIAAITGGVKP